MRRAWKFAALALLLLVVGGGAVLVYPLLTGAVVGLQAGMCSEVAPDPVTGQKLVYCCLDEIYVFQERGLTGELEQFMNALGAAATLNTEQGEAFFNTPYTSALHREYGWQTICGPKIACEQCVFGPQCGNKIVQAEEQCDDGNVVDGDGCTADCRIEQPQCGNGIREGNEQCDDGNTVSGDGCNTRCERDIAPQIAAICGNGKVEIGEECDDGNRTSGDGCSPSCRNEPLPVHPATETGSVATETGSTIVEAEPEPPAMEPLPPEPTEPEIPLSCGNGIIEPPEECDDTNRIPGDGCAPICTVEPGGGRQCGNQSLNRGEQCDDGNVDDGDGCSATCQLQNPGPLSCGDGMVTAGEQCDDGNTADNDGCSRLCRIETWMTMGTASCGNRTLDPGEECDDGNRKDQDGCSDTCFWEFGALGDGIVQHALGEQCEPGISTVPCDANGRFILPNCGDGSLNLREECDIGEENSYSPGAVCRPDCSRSGCGDSIVDPDEGCDDGNRVNGDGCSRVCKLEAHVAGGTPPPPPPATRDVFDPIQAQILAQQRRNALQETGPAAIIFAASGAAAGLGWMRRKRS